MSGKKGYALSLILAIFVLAPILSACSSPAPTAPKPAASAPKTAAPTAAPAAPKPVATTAPAPAQPAPAATKPAAVATTAPKPAAPAAPAVEQKPIKLDLATHLTGGQVQLEAAQKWAEAVKTRTGGKVEVRIYPNEILFPQMQNATAVSSGKVDMAITSDDQLSDKVPALGWVTAFYLQFQDHYHVIRAMDAGMSQIIDDSFKKVNIKAITSLIWSNGSVGTASKVLRVPSDIKGLKMRTFNRELGDFTSRLGGVPVSISSGEVYLAMQRGTLDGFYTTADSVLQRSFYEVAKHWVDIFFRISVTSIAVNMDVWNNKLTQETRQIMMDEGRKVGAWEADIVAKDDAGLVDKLRQKGMTIYTPTAAEAKLWRDSAAFLTEEFQKKAGKDVADRIISIVEKTRK